MDSGKVPKRVDVDKLTLSNILELVQSNFNDISFDRTWKKFKDQIWETLSSESTERYIDTGLTTIRKICASCWRKTIYSQHFI